MLNQNISLPPHWVVGEQKIFNQIRAWQEINRTKKDFRFYFYEKEYDQFDWSIEPKQSWDELVRLRCIQLRQKYKNLKLFYSAGRDSHHVLRSFAKNNIPIDELIIVDYRYNRMRTKDYQKYMLPLAAEYKKINPKVKITTIVTDQQMFDMYYTDGWFENAGVNLQLGYFQPTQFTFMANKAAKVTDSNTAFILGVDKPKLIIEDGNIYTAVLDKILEVHIDSTQSLEYFYYAPELPELHIKQCHMLVNHLEENHPGFDSDFIHEFLDNSKSPYYDEMCRAIGRGPAWNVNLPLQNGKDKYNGSHEVFKIMLEEGLKENWASYFHYQDMVLHLSQTMPYAFHDNDPKNGGTIGIWGKKYFLRKIKGVKNEVSENV